MHNYQKVIYFCRCFKIDNHLKMDFNKDTQYWNKYYKDNPPMCIQESNFAQFVKKYVEKNKKLIDIGCGNGRDSFYFNKLGLNVLGIDASDVVINELNDYCNSSISFKCGNFINDKEIYNQKFDYFYSRFTLHAIDENGENQFLRNCFNALNNNGKLFIEVRSINDEKFGKGDYVERNAYIYDGHYRRFIVLEEILCKLINVGFKIKYAEEEENFAKFGTENSQIIRVVAIKK